MSLIGHLMGGGKRKLGDARRLEERSLALAEAGELDTAVTAAEQALAIRHAVVGDGDPALVDGLRTLGHVLAMADRIEEALPYFGESVRILHGIDGPPDPRFAADALTMATLLWDSDRVDASLPYFGLWVELTRIVDQGRDEYFGPIVLRLCRHFVSTSQLPAAGALLEDNMPTLMEVLDEQSGTYYDLLNMHAAVLEACGRYIEGRAVAERLVDLTSRVFGEHSLQHVDSVSRLSSLRRALHDYAGARELAQWVADVLAAITQGAIAGDGTRSVDRMPDALWSLAECDLGMGNITLAEGNFRQAIELYRDIPEPRENLANALNGLAKLHSQTGHLSRASEMLLQSHAMYAQLFGERSIQCGQVLSDLATVHLKGGNPADADRFMSESVAILKEAVGEEHPAYARSLHDLGVIQCELGRRDRARDLFERSTTALQAVLGPAHPLVANHLQSLGDLNREDGHFAEAEVQLKRALEMMRPVLHMSHANVRTATRSLAAVHAATGRFDQAIELTMVELEGELEMICQLFALSSETQRTRLLAAGTTLNVLLTLVTRHFAGDQAVVQKTFEHVLRRKGMAAEALSAQRESVIGGNHPRLAEALEALRVLRERIACHALAGPGGDDAEAHARSLAEWGARREEQEIALARDIPELALAARLRRADTSAVEAALPAGSALVDFIQYEPNDLCGGSPEPARLVAFVLKAGNRGSVQLIELGVAAQIGRDVSDFRAGLVGRTEMRDVHWSGRAGTVDAGAGERLRVALFDPLLEVLSDSTRLFISPDGELNSLPFEVLPLADGRRLVDDFTISYLSAARDVLRFGAPRSGRPTEPMVLADPDFNLADSAAATADDVVTRARSDELRSAGLTFSSLPGTRTEGMHVADMLGARRCFGRDAIERTLKECRSPRVLHIATHGFFLPDRSSELRAMNQTGRLQERLENPMLRSGLALAGANTWLSNGRLPEGAEDALFNGEDVSGLDLLSTDLVVLSACESGLGEVQAGEGVFGLRRAFVLAGARTLLMSLWKVPDQQTQELMTEFYRRVLDGSPRAEALRQAQLAVRSRYPEPFYWGAFVCLGDPGPLEAFSS